MRRAAAALLVLAVLSFGCTDEGPTATPASTAVTIDGLPPLIVASGQEIFRYVGGRRSSLHRVEDGNVALALSTPDVEGIVFHHQGGIDSSIVRLVDGEAVSIAEDVGLLEAAFVDDAPSVIYAGCDIEDERHGDVIIHELTSQRTRKLTTSCAPEYGVGNVSFGGGVFVVSATSDLTEVFRFYEPDGTLIEDRPSPTDGLPYNEPPFMSHAELTADGSSLAYLEAPDVSGVAGGGENRSGRFNVVVVDQESGKETARVDLPDPATQYQRLDFDGRWLVVSQGEGEPVHVVDTDSDDPEAVPIDLEGIATIQLTSG